MSLGDAVARIVVACAVALSAGCSTFHYTSERPAEDVANCIADGWRHSPWSGWQAPVSVTEEPSHYFVGVELHPNEPAPLVTGVHHPTYPVWAEVHEELPGSTTTYHRAFQIWHAKIDRAVVDCQKTPVAAGGDAQPAPQATQEDSP